MIQISSTSVDNALWGITEKMFRRHTLKEADRIMSPLKWYIATDRAPLDFVRILVNTTERQKSTIARRLEKSATCTYDVAINSVCEYLGYKRD